MPALEFLGVEAAQGLEAVGEACRKVISQGCFLRQGAQCCGWMPSLIRRFRGTGCVRFAPRAVGNQNKRHLFFEVKKLQLVGFPHGDESCASAWDPAADIPNFPETGTLGRRKTLVPHCWLLFTEGGRAGVLVGRGKGRNQSPHPFQAG